MNKINMNELYVIQCMLMCLKQMSQNVINNNGFHYHIQESSDDITNTTYQMDERYAHYDKKLILSKTIEKNIEIIGQSKIWLDKNNKIQTEIFKSVRY